MKWLITKFALVGWQIAVQYNATKNNKQYYIFYWILYIKNKLIVQSKPVKNSTLDDSSNLACTLPAMILFQRW